MDELMDRFNLAPFAEVRSLRTTYTLGGYKIDVDETDFGYRIGEVEVIVESVDDVEEARRRLLQMAGKLGFKSGGVRGKIIEHMRLFSPGHFRTLVECGVISESQLRDLQ